MGWWGPGIFSGLSAMICILLNWKRDLGIQKPRHVSDEQRGILVLRPVIGIRIEDELRVGQVLLKNKRINGIDDHVIASVLGTQKNGPIFAHYNAPGKCAGACRARVRWPQIRGRAS